MEGDIHVIPVDDYREHDESRLCWCKPEVKGNVVIHHAMDGREKYETGELLLH